MDRASCPVPDLLAAPSRHAMLGMALALLAAPGVHAQSDRFDNFQMRKAIPTELKEVGPGLYFLYDDLSSNSTFLVTEEGVLVVDTRQHPKEEAVKTLRFPQYAHLRNYNRVNVFIEALYHLNATGKPLFPYP